jgi:hypothetical protein
MTDTFKNLNKFHLVTNVSINDKHKHEHNKYHLCTFINKHKIIRNSWQQQNMTLEKMHGKKQNAAMH